MPGFLYFIETNKKAALAADLDAAGVGYSLSPNVGVSSRHIMSGPGNAAGLIITHECDRTEPAYKPDAQTWRKGKGAWVGMSNDARPGLDDLARPKIYAGSPVELLDGNHWIIPRCHGVLEDRGQTLPLAMDLDEDGDTLITRIHPRFARLSEAAAQWWQIWSGLASTPFPIDKQIQLAIDALSANYRIGRVESLALLSLWSTDEFGLVLRALIDADAVENYFIAQKQKPGASPDAESPSPGETESAAAK